MRKRAGRTAAWQASSSIDSRGSLSNLGNCSADAAATCLYNTTDLQARCAQFDFKSCCSCQQGQVVCDCSLKANKHCICCCVVRHVSLARAEAKLCRVTRVKSLAPSQRICDSYTAAAAGCASVAAAGSSVYQCTARPAATTGAGENPPPSKRLSGSAQARLPVATPFACAAVSRIAALLISAARRFSSGLPCCRFAMENVNRVDLATPVLQPFAIFAAPLLRSGL